MSYFVFSVVSAHGVPWTPSFVPFVRTERDGRQVLLVDSVALVLPTSLCSGQIGDIIAHRLNERLHRERLVAASEEAGSDVGEIYLVLGFGGCPKSLAVL